MDIVLQGIKFGVVLAFLVGPVFFTLLQTSVERGFRTGLIMALGISLSDVLYVTICYLGIAQFISDPKFHVQMAYLGGGILILFGLYYLVIKAWRSSNYSAVATEEKRSYRYFFKGFIINGLSPTVPLFWIGTISLASLDMGYSTDAEILMFFGSLLVTVLLTDIAKAYLAGKLRSFINVRVLRVINIVLGVGLLAFGIRLIWPVI
jgi:threonine/homoserine/homoserine lactone efflux protein